MDVVLMALAILRQKLVVVREAVEEEERLAPMNQEVQE